MVAVGIALVTMVLTRQEHCLALRNTSLWLLFPVAAHCLCDTGLRFCLAPLCLAVCAASYLHWDDHSMVGWRRIADITLASSYLILEFAMKQHVVPVDILLRLASLLCLVLCWNLPIGSAVGLTRHLMFRYLGWIAVMRSYIPPFLLAALSPAYVVTAIWAVNPIGTFELLSPLFLGRSHYQLSSFSQPD